MTETVATLEAQLAQDYLHPEVRAEIERKIANKVLESDDE